jgi:hypothetical protein
VEPREHQWGDHQSASRRPNKALNTVEGDMSYRSRLLMSQRIDGLHPPGETGEPSEASRVLPEKGKSVWLKASCSSSTVSNLPLDNSRLNS